MSNGHRALATLPLPEITPAEAPADKPIAIANHDAGTALAAATAALYCAMIEYQQCGLLDRTRLPLGENTAQIAMLCLAHRGDDRDFFAHARAAAHAILRRELDGQCTPAQADRLIEFCSSAVLEVAQTVVASERELAAAMTRQERMVGHG